MKRAKIALTAIAIIAIVSGSLAFKAQKAFGSTIYVGNAAGEFPTSTLVGWTITASTVPGAVKTFATTSSTTTLVETFITTRQ